MFGQRSLSAVTSLDNEALRDELTGAGHRRLPDHTRADLIDAVYCLRNKMSLPDWISPKQEARHRKVSSKWFMREGLYRRRVTVPTWSGDNWVTRLRRRQVGVNSLAEALLRTPQFVVGTGRHYDLAIMRGSDLSQDQRRTSSLRQEAFIRGLRAPVPAVGCVLRVIMSDELLKSMGMSQLIIMHNPIPDLFARHRLLQICSGNDLRAVCLTHDKPWDCWSGFVFAVSK